MRTKKLYTLGVVTGICFLLAAYGTGSSSQFKQSNKEETSSKELENKKETTMQMSVSANGNTIIYELNDSKAAKDLYEQLPLSIKAEPYAKNEIIFYPTSALDVSDTQLASGGGAGTIAYYAPWGDVVLFYDSFGSASGLYELGQVVSGSEYIKSMSGTISLTKTNE